jgi:hypothetical protein
MVSEMAADDASWLVADGPSVLAECLVEMGSRLAKPRLIGALPTSGFSSHLGYRVERLMNHKSGAWSRPHRLRAALFKILGPAALAVVVILSTAWTAPRALMKEDTMKIVPLNWKQTLAALTAATSLATPAVNAGSKEDPMSPRAEAGTPIAASDRSGGAKDPAAKSADSTRSAQIEAKLKHIILDNVQFDGLPLPEVLRSLSEQSSKRDPSKVGINFLLNPNTGTQVTTTSGYGPVDPTTGLPVVPIVEQLDMSAITIRFNLPLRNVSMKDVLDAIVKVADHPIEYTVEDYAVVFSSRSTSVPPISPGAGLPPLTVRTFRMNTNTFVSGLESAFGIKLATNVPAGERPQKVQAALRALMTQLGVPVENGRSVFYNELTGVVMVRTTSDEIDVVSAAMETLGGTVEANYGAGNGPAPGIVLGQPPR